MAEIVVVQCSLEEDLGPFSRYLWQQKLPHRIVEHEDRQLLLVGSNDDAMLVARSYREFKAGNTELPPLKREQKEHEALWAQWWQTPATLLLVILSLLGYLIVRFDGDYDLVRYLTFFDFQRVGFSVQFSFEPSQLWRLFTPVFLHFSILHIVFNSLWLWDLGRRIERLRGTLGMVAIVSFLGVGSNLTQAMFAEISVFGGMSGVIYGLLGFGWVWSAICPEKNIGIPPVVVNFMLIWMFACLFGLAEMLGAGAVANASHVGGLVLGMILGALAAGLEKITHPS